MHFAGPRSRWQGSKTCTRRHTPHARCYTLDLPVHTTDQQHGTAVPRSGTSTTYLQRARAGRTPASATALVLAFCAAGPPAIVRDNSRKSWPSSTCSAPCRTQQSPCRRCVQVNGTLILALTQCPHCKSLSVVLTACLATALTATGHIWCHR